VARGTRDTKIQVIEVSVSSLYISSLWYYFYLHCKCIIFLICKYNFTKFIFQIVLLMFHAAASYKYFLVCQDHWMLFLNII
jgi:hypothetical protein